MSKAKLCQERIDRSNLNTCLPAAVPRRGGLNMIVAIRHNERYRGKAVQNLRAGFRTREALQKLLENKACGHEHLACFDGTGERLDLLGLRRRVTPKRERPNAGIDEEAQSRLRSAL